MTTSAAIDSKRQIPAGETLVDVKDLRMYFPVTAGLLVQRKIADVRAVDGLNFQAKSGETLGLVGESGCGKSTTGRAVLQLYRPTSGSVNFAGTELTNLKGGDLRRFRRRMQMIFQDPMSSLNPRMRAGEILAQPLLAHGLATPAEARARAEIGRAHV